MNEENIKNIDKLKIVCNSCQTEIILPFDTRDLKLKGVYTCPKCNNSFGIDKEDDIFYRLSDLIRSVQHNKSASFYLICEEKQ